MRRYDDPVEVRRGHLEEPCEFWWRGRLWSVRTVVSHWVETGPWWTSPAVRAVLGTEGTSEEALVEADAAADEALDRSGGVATLDTLLGEQETWRVEALVPRRPGRPPLRENETGYGVFDLTFSWSTGCWRLTGCLD